MTGITDEKGSALPVTSSEILDKLLIASEGYLWKDDTMMLETTKIQNNTKTLLTHIKNKPQHLKTKTE